MLNAPAGRIQLNRDGPLYILRGHKSLFPKYIVFFSLQIDFLLTNSADPDKMSLSPLYVRVPVSEGSFFPDSLDVTTAVVVPHRVVKTPRTSI